jgi:hypothetical protein
VEREALLSEILRDIREEEEFACLASERGFFTGFEEKSGSRPCW